MRIAVVAGMLAVWLVGTMSGQGQAALTVSVATLQVPASAREHLARARKAALAGREDEYEREIARALDLDRHFAGAYLFRGAQEVFRRDFEAALTDSYLAERLDHGLDMAKLVRASALNGLRRYGEAWAALDEMGAGEASMWEVKFERARAAVGRKDAVGALRWSAETLATVPVESLDGARVLRGDALVLAGRYGDAVEVWREYLASPRTQVYREQVLTAIARVERLQQGQEIAGVGR